MAKVNPPPIRVPRSLSSDPEVLGFFNDLLFHLQQLWRRTGAGTDFIENNTLSETLLSISVLGTAADKGLYTTGINSWAEFNLTAAGRAIAGGANASDQRSTLGLGSLSTQDANNVNISGGSIAGITDLTVTDGGTGASDASGARTNLGLVIGSDVQAYSVNLDEAVTFFGATNISGAEAETLTDASNADALHIHSTTGISDVTSGTYTPTLTNTTNIDSSTASACQYLRVGNTVLVSGKVSVDPTATAASALGISLPIASNFGATEQCAGSASSDSVASESAAIRADATNDRAEMAWVTTSTASADYYFTFAYRII